MYLFARLEGRTAGGLLKAPDQSIDFDSSLVLVPITYPF